jgi:hypothetical protein
LIEWFDRQTDDQKWIDFSSKVVVATANGGAAWTIDLSDVQYLKYKRLRPGVAIVRGAFNPTTLVGANATELMVKIPDIVPSGNDSFGFMFYSDNGFVSTGIGYCIARVPTGLFGFKKADGAKWGESTNGLFVLFSVMVECN